MQLSNVVVGEIYVDDFKMGIDLYDPRSGRKLLPSFARTVARVVEYPVNSIDLGGERGVADGVAEPDPEAYHRAALDARLGHHRERHREAAERPDQQQKRQLSAGCFDHRRAPVDPKHRAHEPGQRHTCERVSLTVVRATRHTDVPGCLSPNRVQ